jgi:hypothetical protein
MFAMMFAMAIERQAINWLTNRHGCTYNKLQKCIELDIRKDSIDEKWPVSPPKYDPEGYRSNYFRPDFDELLKRFKETEKESYLARKKSLNDDKEIRDFVP